MEKGRLEAFSDGVIAILITIMVLDLKIPQGTDWQAMRPMFPTLFSYVLSYIYLGIYWNNHHHMLQACKHVNGKILWANLHLLFWLSLVPFLTNWNGQYHFAALPTALYGAVLIMAAFAYTILQRSIIRLEGAGSKLGIAVGSDFKGKLSLALYAAGIIFALLIHPWISAGLYVLVALIWLVPDRRIESRMSPERG
jgi:uncharacterized membrane protein